MEEIKKALLANGFSKADTNLILDTIDGITISPNIYIETNQVVQELAAANARIAQVDAALGALTGAAPKAVVKKAVKATKAEKPAPTPLEKEIETGSALPEKVKKEKPVKEKKGDTEAEIKASIADLGSTAPEVAKTIDL